MIDYADKSSFVNWAKFEAFSKSLKEDVEWEILESYDSGEIDLGFFKIFFRSKSTGEVWELVEPDPPFRGSWTKLTR